MSAVSPCKTGRSAQQEGNILQLSDQAFYLHFSRDENLLRGFITSEDTYFDTLASFQ